MNAAEPPQVVVAGHICLDVIPSFRTTKAAAIGEIFVPGKLINMGPARVSTGGPVSNTGIALGILGVPTRLMGKIGDDFFGEGVLRLLRERGAADGMRVAPAEQTSYTVVVAPPGCDRIFLHSPGANDTFRADDIHYELVSQTRLFHFGYPPLMRGMFANDGEELIEIFRSVKSLGVTTSLDMSLPDASSESGRVDWDRLLQRLLPYVDIFLPSVEETMFMVARDEFDRLNRQAAGHDLLEALDLDCLPPLGAKLISYGARIAVIKCGVKGYYIRTSNPSAIAAMGAARPADPGNWAGRELHEESFHVPEVASATGSGDSSIAGFLAAFLKGSSIEDAIRIACAVGAQNVRTYDATSGIKPWGETLAMIPGWQKNHIHPVGAYWRYDAGRQLRFGRQDKGFGASPDNAHEHHA